jgi:hypothetical protein
MKRTVLLFLILLVGTPLISQVTIRERVQISPHNIQPQLSTQAATTLRAECSFTGPVDNNEPRIFYIIGPCGNSAGLLSINGSISSTSVWRWVQVWLPLQRAAERWRWTIPVCVVSWE